MFKKDRKKFEARIGKKLKHLYGLVQIKQASYLYELKF